MSVHKGKNVKIIMLFWFTDTVNTNGGIQQHYEFTATFVRCCLTRAALGSPAERAALGGGIFYPPPVIS